MKRLLVVVFFLNMVGPGSFAADLSGNWDVTVQAPGGPEVRLLMVLTQSGSEVKGTMRGPRGWHELQEPKLQGEQLTFRMLLGPGLFDIRVTVGANAMKGTFTGPGQAAGSFVARRADEVGEAFEKTETRVELGGAGGSAWRVDIPANYNGSLILYCHGYGPRFTYDESPLDAMLKVFAAEGYAVAQAGYSAAGWAFAEALRDTDALRRQFSLKHGKPRRVFVAGHSLGALVAVALVEKYPLAYDGALSMCGPLGASLEVLQRRVFDSLVMFDYYFPGVIGTPVKLKEEVRLSPDYGAELQKVVDAEPPKRALVAEAMGVPETQVGALAGFYASIQKELTARTGGNPFDNRNTIYPGADPLAVNRGAGRFSADPAALLYVKRNYTPTGKPAKPILALHNVEDPIIPAWAAGAYGDLARQNGGDGLFVLRFVPRAGHCAITNAEVQNAFRDLRAWRDSGKRPSPGEQQ